MSRIKRLSIRGVRNFSDENDAASIQFSRPMTLILGPNGTGKTTIIECLKFATTGDFPPGTENGKCFIFDTKLSLIPTVRGVVKAEIIDKKGDSVVISRTVECQQQPKSIRMKSLDSSVTRINCITKKKTSIGGRCADITAEAIRALGVSKPIINYVLFCHQEELNWPFDEGKKLKEKFDEIFGTSKFNKALDNLRSITKSHNVTLRILKAEKDACRILVEQVHERENKIQEINDRKIKSAERSKRISDELTPIQENIRDNENKEIEYKKMVVNEDKKKMECNLIKKEIDNLKSTIHKIYEGSSEQLQLDLEVDESFLDKKSENIKELESQMKVEEKKEQRLLNEIAEQRVQIGTLKQKMEDQNNRIVSRNTILEKALATFDTTINLKNSSEDEIEEWTKLLGEKFETLENDIEDTRRKKEQEEQILQKEVDSLRAEKSKIESITNLRDNELLDIRKEIKNVQSEIAEVGIAGRKLNEIELKLREVNNRCDALDRKMDINATKTKISDELKNRNKIEDQIHVLDEEISLMHQNSSLQAELDLHKSALEAKQKQIESIKSKHKTNITTLLKVDQVPMKKLKATLDGVYQNLMKEKDSYNHKLEREKVNVTSLQASLKHDENDLKKKEDKLRNDKAKVSAYCNYENYEDIVAQQLRKVKSLQDDRGMYAYQGVAFKKYLEKVDSRDPCCPLCNREFQNAQEAHNLSIQMKDEMETMPQILKTCETKLKKEQQKYDNILQLKPIVDEILNFEENESGHYKDLIEEKSKKLRESKQKINEIRSAMEEPENLLVIWKNVSSDIVLWDQCFDDIKKIQHQIENVKLRMPSAGKNFDKTMEEAQRERNLLKNSMKELRDQIEGMQTALNNHCEKVEKARDQRLALQEEKLRLSANMQKLQQFHDKESELSAKKDKLLKTIQEFKQQLVTAEDQLETAIVDLDKKRVENVENIKNDRLKIDRISKRIYELKKIQSEIDNFIDNKTEEKLQRLEERIKSYDEMITTLKESKNKLEKKIANVREDMMQQELSKRNLLDNLKLRKKEAELESLNKQWEHLKTCVKNFQIDKLRNARKLLREEEEKLTKEKNHIEGMQAELSRNIRDLKSQLEKKDFKNAYSNYKLKASNLVLINQLVENLKAYSKVLDASMIDYHEERMKTVNQIMDRLWRRVYSGHDTSTIQIHTSATEGVDSGRRIYNYKLIQKKNGAEMDMKGRCSAGQRVLTSIIIRLALAETFCGDCGVMALDEPTTNLDAVHSNNLADALCDIVQHRSQIQKSFQLIVISHDEPFINRLAQVNSNRSYYLLKRNPDGRSMIQYQDGGGNAMARPLATFDESSDDDDDDVNVATLRA